MKKWEKLKWKMEKLLRKKWTEIKKINKGCFSSSEDILFTHPTFYQYCGSRFICRSLSISVALYSSASVATLMFLWMAKMGQMGSFWQYEHSMWSCQIKGDEVHSTAIIYQNLGIPSFWYSTCLAYHVPLAYDITTWKKANITGKIFIS